MDETDSVLGTPRRFMPKIVGGTELASSKPRLIQARPSVSRHVDTPSQHGGRKRNPWRHPADKIVTAALVAGRLHRGESLKGWDFIPALREAAAAARELSVEFDRLADENGDEVHSLPRRLVDIVQEPDREEEQDPADVRPRRVGGNMHTYIFRSYDLIAEADEADLIRDVSCDIHKARVKLGKVQQQLRTLRDRAREQFLASVETKLAAAIVAALLSTRRL